MNTVRKFFSLLVLLGVAAYALSQSDGVFAFQTAVVDAHGMKKSNSLVHVRISIMMSSAEGELIYAEHSSAMSDSNGWINVMVGEGVPLRGDFKKIDWSRGPYFMRCDIDPDGGNDYKMGAAQQLLNVPSSTAGKKHSEASAVRNALNIKESVDGMSREEIRLYVDSLMNSYFNAMAAQEKTSNDGEAGKAIPQMPLEPASVNGVLPGRFSVSSTSSVHFSQGNLRYSEVGRHQVMDGSTRQGTWSFMPRQYESPTSDTVWTEYFMWGNTGSQGYDFSGREGYDFGLFNAIVNGGNRAGQWRMLTAEEWNYMRNERNEAKHKIALATVVGCRGVVLLPDDWRLPEECVFVSGSAVGFATNTYNAYLWSLMEQAGAVFLPAAGSMNSGRVYSKGRYGSYWTSTMVDAHSSYSFDFEEAGYQTIGNHSSLGLSVRLVRDVHEDEMMQSVQETEAEKDNVIDKKTNIY
ncbi:MAG: hypothetical protein IJR13_03145 [Bacteroidales bacterium]|nr:hypothetical protein [Bacteroidales bacterium]